MPIVVSDTSVLIDLERGNLLGACFALDHELAVPDLLFRRELEPVDGNHLVELGLLVVELTGEEVSAAQVLRGAHPKLSFEDAFAMTLATQRGWPLLTGDGLMRQLCQEREHPHHGVLWVCDRIFEAGQLPVVQLVEGLTAIADHPRCRLPRAELNACLARYRVD